MLLSKLSNFIRNLLHLNVPMEVGVSDIPMCIKDVPKYLVLKSLNDMFLDHTQRRSTVGRTPLDE